MHAQRTCKTTMCRPRAFSHLLCVLHADINKQEHTVWIRAQKKKTKGILWGLTAEEKVGCWRSQQLWTGGQWADKSKDPAKHQEDEAERQQNDHYFVQACKHTHLKKNINIYIYFFKSAIFQLTPIIQGPADFLFPLSVLKSTSRDSIEFFSHSGQFITAFYLSMLQAGSVPENPNKTDFI